MNIKSFIFLIQIISSVIFANAIINTNTVTYTGSLSGNGCSICQSSYVCSNDFLHWNNGLHVIPNVVPAGNIVTGVNVTLAGTWGCSGSTSKFIVAFQTTTFPTIHATGQCGCNTCDNKILRSSVINQYGFPAYNYLGGNILNITLLSGSICLSKFNVTLSYRAGTPGQSVSLLPGPPTCPGGCGTHGTCNVTGTVAACVCDVSWGGPNCQCNIPSYDLITDHPPVFDFLRSGFLTKDTLTLYLNVSVKYYKIAVNFQNQLSNTCTYAQANQQIFWLTTFNPNVCTYSIVGTIPWIVAYPTCVFDRHVTSSQIVFSGAMMVDMLEKIPQVRNYNLPRPIKNVLPFQIVYPKSVVVTAPDVYVFSPIDIQAAITSQIAIQNVPTIDTGAITLLTSIQAPYRLTYTSSASDSPYIGITASGPNLNSNCPVNGQTACNQYWDIVLTPSANQCTFNSYYLFNFTISCQPGTQHCPLSGVTKGYIRYQIMSSYFCNQIIASIDLSGSMTLYDSQQLTNVISTGFQNTFGYYVTTLLSNKATIIGAAYNQIYVVYANGTSYLLYDVATGNTVKGNLASTVVSNIGYPVTQNQCAFSVKYVPSVFPVATDSFAAFTIQALIDVTYMNTAPQSIENGQVMMSLTPGNNNNIVKGGDSGTYQGFGINCNFVINSVKGDYIETTSGGSTVVVSTMSKMASAVVASVIAYAVVMF